MTGTKKYLYPFLLFIFFAASILAVSPRGNFPLNDDWAYSYSLKHLFDHGSIKLSDWAAPTMIFQVYWGWAWCKLFGKFDFQILRLSTIVLSCAGIYFFYFLLNKVSKNELLSFFGALALLYNPLWFILSLSYMTDVPYLAVSFISVYCFYAGIKEDKEKFLIYGAIFSSLGYLIRQLGILIPFSVVLYLFLNKNINARKLAKICLIPIIIAVSHRYWLQYVHGLTWTYKTGQDLRLGFDQVIPRLLGSTIYAGIFVLPFSVSALFSGKAVSSKEKLGISGQAVFMCTAIAVLIFILAQGSFPYFENIINNYGLGTITAHNMSFKSRGLFATGWFWSIITFSGALSFLIFLYNFIKNIKLKSQLMLFIFVFLSQFMVSVVKYKFFDRYTMPLLPLMIIAYIEFFKNRKIHIAAYALTLSLLAIYSCIGSMDYFSWNRAKWDAGNALVKQGFAYNEIANGFDWDGWYTYQNNMDTLKKQKPEKSITEWEWQSLNPYRVIVSFKPPDDPLKLCLKIAYKTPLKNGDNYIYAEKIY